MKTTFAMFLTLFLTFPFSFSIEPDSIIGKWENSDQSRVLEFVKSGNSYEARILEAKDSDLIGQNQLTDIIFSKENEKYEGVLHIIQRNRTIPASLTLIDSNTMEIEVSKGPFSKKEKWVKIQ